MGMLTGSAMETLTRIGFAARGLMYLTIGWLALSRGQAEDNQGAIAKLSEGGGSPLLVVMALGFTGYAVWRLSEALVDSEGHGHDPKGLAVRVGGGVSGIVHLLFALFALRLGLGWSSGSGGGGGTEQGAAMAMRLPGGTLLLVVAAAALAGTGLFQLVKAWRADFLKHFSPDVANKPWVQWSGRLGYAARGLVFLVLGWFALTAARSGNAGEAQGPDAALASLPGALFIVVALGFVLFGVFSFIEARYRRITDPKVLDRLKGQAHRPQRA